jgi:hypothetical protein
MSVDDELPDGEQRPAGMKAVRCVGMRPGIM